MKVQSDENNDQNRRYLSEKQLLSQFMDGSLIDPAAAAADSNEEDADSLIKLGDDADDEDDEDALNEPSLTNEDAEK